MLDPLTAVEIQALRLQLHSFADLQNDRAVQIHCFTVDANLGRALEAQEDETRLNQLAASVQRLENALRSARRAPRSVAP